MKEKPWESRWKVVDGIGQGGQGTTYRVQSVDSDQTAVMKVLRNQKSQQARRRMFQEVSNLKILESAGCKVPVVIDSNAQQFASNDVPLYFVMQQISGRSLAEVVKTGGGLAFAVATPLVLDMLVTMRMASQEGVIHRDVKPENIIVRSLKPSDAVMVDYGLSFNDDLEEPVTRTSETLDNKFLSLPERRVPGGNRRDPRSDITGLCGLLYFCLTGSSPVDLVGPDGQPPHRRSGHSIRERLGDAPEVARLESFFDKGFNPHIDNRYQTFDEFESRLSEVVNPAARTPNENLADVAKRAAAALLNQDPKTQKAEFRSAAAMLPSELHGICNTIGRDIAPSFILQVWRALERPLIDVPETVEVDVQFVTAIRHKHNPHCVVVAYQVRTKGPECGIFRAMFKGAKPNVRHLQIIEQWQPLFWYRGLTRPDMPTVGKDFEASIAHGIDLLQQIILEQSTVGS